MPTLERALQIAVEAHAGQKDKNGGAYIFHPIRVMMRCRSEPAKIAALLHDVVEDTNVSLEELKTEGFSAQVLEAVRLLTRESGLSYDDFIKRIRPNELAVEVKLADLADNMDPRRLTEFDPKAGERFQRYLRAWRFLGGGDA